MGFFTPEALYNWSPAARDQMQRIAQTMAAKPECRASMTNRRPAIFRRRLVIAAAYGDGIAVRINDPRLPSLVRPITVKGLRPLGASQMHAWADMIQRAYDEAG